MKGIHCTFEGVLGRNSQLKQVRGDLTLCAFPCAVDEGSDKESATWIRVAVFGEPANEVHPLKKADRVYIEGILKTNKWTGKDGQVRMELDVSAWKVVAMGKIGRRRKPRKRAEPKPESAPEPFEGYTGDPGAPFDDDLSHLGG